MACLVARMCSTTKRSQVDSGWLGPGMAVHAGGEAGHVPLEAQDALDEVVARRGVFQDVLADPGHDRNPFAPVSAGGNRHRYATWREPNAREGGEAVPRTRPTVTCRHGAAVHIRTGGRRGHTSFATACSQVLAPGT